MTRVLLGRSSQGASKYGPIQTYEDQASYKKVVKKKAVRKSAVRKKHAGGRPTLFKKEYAEQAKKLALLGATDKQLANFFSVKEQTINNWKLAHPEFFESLKEGKEELDNQVVKSLFHRATGYSHAEDKIFNNNGAPLIVSTVKHYPPDPTSAIFWLKNRQPKVWRDKKEIDVTNIHDLCDEELKAKLSAYVGS